MFIFFQTTVQIFILGEFVDYFSFKFYLIKNICGYQRKALKFYPLESIDLNKHFCVVQVVSNLYDPVEWLKAIKAQLRSLINLFTLIKGFRALQVQSEANWKSANEKGNYRKRWLYNLFNCLACLTKGFSAVEWFVRNQFLHGDRLSARYNEYSMNSILL